MAYGPPKIKVMIPKPKKVADHFPQEVAQEQRRLTGVTRGFLHGYQESPARLLPHTGGIKSLAGATKMKGGRKK